MTIEKLQIALKEADRFRIKARIALSKLQGHGKYSYPYPCKERAAARRASLDLTRCLADLRRAD